MSAHRSGVKVALRTPACLGGKSLCAAFQRYLRLKRLASSSELRWSIVGRPWGQV